MPLSLTEQMDIVERRVGPPNSAVTLFDLVQIESYGQAINFVNTAKIITGTTQTDQLASSYKNKVLRLTDKIFQGNASITQALLTTLVANGAPNTDISTIQGLAQSGWENFVSNNIFEGLEYVATVRAEEKSAYNSLP